MPGLQPAVRVPYRLSYPADAPPEQLAYAQHYRHAMHPSLAFAAPPPQRPTDRLVLPNDLGDSKNTLSALIAADPTLQTVFSATAFTMELGDETIALHSQLFQQQRTKHEHVFTYQLYANCLQPSARFGPDYLQCDLSDLIALHRPLYLRGVLNNLFVTTAYLRDYHYQKQKNNAF